MSVTDSSDNKYVIINKDISNICIFVYYLNLLVRLKCTSRFLAQPCNKICIYF